MARAPVPKRLLTTSELLMLKALDGARISYGATWAKHFKSVVTRQLRIPKDGPAPMLSEGQIAYVQKLVIRHRRSVHPHQLAPEDRHLLHPNGVLKDVRMVDWGSCPNGVLRLMNSRARSFETLIALTAKRNLLMICTLWNTCFFEANQYASVTKPVIGRLVYGHHHGVLELCEGENYGAFKAPPGKTIADVLRWLSDWWLSRVVETSLRSYGSSE